MKNETKKLYRVVFTIRRYDPEKDAKPHYERYSLDVEPGMTVLDGLHVIREEQDPTLSWRYSCRMGVCGSCGMLVNGKPMLACNNQILDISKKALVIAPLPNFDIIKDLVPDLTDMFEKGLRPGEAIKQIQQTVGLTAKQAERVARRAEASREAGFTEEQIDRITEEHSNKLRRQRAKAIARTETADGLAQERNSWTDPC